MKMFIDIIIILKIIIFYILIINIKFDIILKVKI